LLAARLYASAPRWQRPAGYATAAFGFALGASWILGRM
jgi:hypothetical protein